MLSDDPQTQTSKINLEVDAANCSRNNFLPMLGESKNQFSLTCGALGTGGDGKRNLLSLTAAFLSLVKVLAAESGQAFHSFEVQRNIAMKSAAAALESIEEPGRISGSQPTIRRSRTW